MSGLFFRYALPMYDELVVRTYAEFMHDAKKPRPSEIPVFEVCLSDTISENKVLLPHCQLLTTAIDYNQTEYRYTPPQESVAKIDPDTLEVLQWPRGTTEETRSRYARLLLISQMQESLTCIDAKNRYGLTQIPFNLHNG